jgi:hypothetical protein
MPRPGSYPCDSGREECLQIDSVDFGFLAFAVNKGEYSVTVYSDDSIAIILPESKRKAVQLQTGEDCVCIRASSFRAIRI